MNISNYEIFHNLKEYFIFIQSVILFQNDKNTDEFEKLQYFSFFRENPIIWKIDQNCKIFQIGSIFQIL